MGWEFPLAVGVKQVGHGWHFAIAINGRRLIGVVETLDASSVLPRAVDLAGQLKQLLHEQSQEQERRGIPPRHSELVCTQRAILQMVRKLCSVPTNRLVVIVEFETEVS
jgi:hypothetical protein